jgi:hypothetical protein
MRCFGKAVADIYEVPGQRSVVSGKSRGSPFINLSESTTFKFSYIISYGAFPICKRKMTFSLATKASPQRRLPRLNLHHHTTFCIFHLPFTQQHHQPHNNCPLLAPQTHSIAHHDSGQQDGVSESTPHQPWQAESRPQRTRAPLRPSR